MRSPFRHITITLLLAATVATVPPSATADDDPATTLPLPDDAVAGAMAPAPADTRTEYINAADILIVSGDRPLVLPLPTDAEVATLLADASQVWTEATGRTFGFDPVRIIRATTTTDQCISGGVDYGLGLAFAEFGTTYDDYSAAGQRDLIVLFAENCLLHSHQGLTLTGPAEPALGVGGIVADVLGSNDLALTLAHELGHTYGLGHSGVDTCLLPDYAGENWYQRSRSCTTAERGDPWTLMGEYGQTDPDGNALVLTPLQRWYLGLADDTAEVLQGPIDTTVTLTADSPNLVVAVDPEAPGDLHTRVYSVDWRPGVDRSGIAEVGQGDDPGGLYITEGTDCPVCYATTRLVQPMVGLDAGLISLTPGPVFTSPSGRVIIRVEELTASRAVVRVIITGSSTVPSASLRVTDTADGGEEVTKVAVGGTLCAVDTWTNPQPARVEYRWFRDNTTLLASDSNLFSPTAAEAGHLVTAEVSAYDGDGGLLAIVRSRGVWVGDGPLAVSTDQALTGDTVDLTVRLRDGAARLVSVPWYFSAEAPVWIEVDDGGRLELTEDPAAPGTYRATLTSPVPGPIRLTVYHSGFHRITVRIDQATVTFALPAGVTATAGVGSPGPLYNDLGGKPTTELSQDLVAALATPAGEPRPGVEVSFAVADPRVSLMPAVATTNTAGVARVAAQYPGEWTGELGRCLTTTFTATAEGRSLTADPIPLTVCPNHEARTQVFPASAQPADGQATVRVTYQVNDPNLPGTSLGSDRLSLEDLRVWSDQPGVTIGPVTYQSDAPGYQVEVTSTTPGTYALHAQWRDMAFPDRLVTFEAEDDIWAILRQLLAALLEIINRLLALLV